MLVVSMGVDENALYGNALYGNALYGNALYEIT